MTLLENIVCPVCQEVQKDTEPLDLCPVCGWEFMFFVNAIPNDLEELIENKAQTHKIYRNTFLQTEEDMEHLQKNNGRLKNSITKQEAELIRLEEVYNTLKNDVNRLQKELSKSNENEIKLQIKKIENLVEERKGLVLPLSIKGIIECSYSQGIVSIKYPNDIDKSDLPRLVLGLSQKSNIAFVTDADIIYLLPALDDNTYSSEEDTQGNVLLKRPIKLNVPNNICSKFGLYQIKSNQYFNIKTI